MPTQMTRAEYEAKYGSQVPDPRPEVQNSLNMASDKPSAFSDLGNDVKTAFNNVKQGFEQRTERTGQNIASGQNPFSTGLQHVGNVAGTVSDTLVQGGLLAGKAFLTQDQEDAIAQKIGQVGTRLSENAQTNPTTAPIADGVKSIVSQWNEFKVDNPEAAANLEAGGSIVDALTLLTGVGAAKNLPKEAFDAAGDVIKTTVTKADDLAALRRASQLESQTERANTAATRVTQMKVDADKRPRATQNAVDAFTKGVETPDGRVIRWDISPTGNDYTVFNKRGLETLDQIRKEQDTYLQQFDTRFTASQVGRFQEVNGRAIVSTPVQDALEQMQKYYKSTSDAVGESQVTDWMKQLETDGLTVQELNEIARKHGTDLNAFNANNQLASGLNKQSWENTRQGIKDVVRQRLPDDYSKELDTYYSQVRGTLDHTLTVQKRADEITQRLTDRSLVVKFQEAVTEVLDIVSIRTLTGIANKINPGRAIDPTNTALQMQRELDKNLLQLKRLSEIKDSKTLMEQVKEYISTPKGGLSINPIKLQELKSRRDEVYAQMIRTQDATAKKRLQKLHQELDDQVRKMQNQ